MRSLFPFKDDTVSSSNKSFWLNPSLNISGFPIKWLLACRAFFTELM